MHTIQAYKTQRRNSIKKGTQFHNLSTDPLSISPSPSFLNLPLASFAALSRSRAHPHTHIIESSEGGS